ncbi:Palmitoyl-protein thioesterase 1 [Chytridiales sp. JEL 0842]|nr:Palmitoyl-protein thioesterase 1 [Chytridiales sp. JEL 0842]
MGYITSLIQEELPGTYVHSIRVGETEEEDRNHGFFDLLNRQVEEVCQQLKKDPILSDGFNGLGFSQGGLFLRAYVQRCNNPPVHNLVTFGSPHMGVLDSPGCDGKNTANCMLMRRLIKSGAYLPWVQNRVVQAQYFKDPRNLEAYYAGNVFLPQLNNELAASKNMTYKLNLASLNKFAMIRFSEEQTVVPAESTWFGFYDENLEPVEMRKQPLYFEDWLGLK